MTSKNYPIYHKLRSLLQAKFTPPFSPVFRSKHGRPTLVQVPSSGLKPFKSQELTWWGSPMHHSISLQWNISLAAWFMLVLGKFPAPMIIGLGQNKSRASSPTNVSTHICCNKHKHENSIFANNGVYLVCDLAPIKFVPPYSRSCKWLIWVVVVVHSHRGQTVFQAAIIFYGFCFSFFTDCFITSRPFLKNGGRYCFGFRRRLRGCFALYLGCY